MNIGADRPPNCECERMPSGLVCDACTEKGFSNPANVVQKWDPK